MPREEGYYTVNGVLTEEESLSLKTEAAKGDRPVVGLILHQTHIANENTRHIDAILEGLAHEGALALPMFTGLANDEDDKRGIRHAMERYFVHEGNRLPDVILVMTGFSLTHMGWPGDGLREMEESIFAAWDVPVLQVMATRFSPEDYEKKPQGMDSMSISTSVFQPELDGQILTVPCAAQVISHEDGVERKIYMPMPDRVERVCKLAVNWAKLSRMPNEEKKIAILFNTMPGNAKIGCAEGLDTFESVLRAIEALKAQGVYTEFDFENAQNLADRLTSSLTNDLRDSEEAMIDHAAATVEPEVWKMVRPFERQDAVNWNTLGEGSRQNHGDRRKNSIPSIINGNILSDCNPPRFW